MFAGFNLKITEDYFDTQQKSLQEYQEIGKTHLNLQAASIKRALKEYIKNNIIDGSRIQKDWFPKVEADIFLSHSSKDTQLVNAIAGWMNDTFGLKCFIDSNVWGYAGEIADLLNAEYSDQRVGENGGYLYSHNKCSKVAEHVNTMLNVALQKMIDKSESIFLINTDQSIKINSEPDSIDLTYSPWIYSELMCSEIVRKKPLATYRYNLKSYYPVYESDRCDNKNKELTISYDAPTQHLIKINQDDLGRWKGKYDEKYDKKYPFPLDILYEDYFNDLVAETRDYFGY